MKKSIFADMVHKIGEVVKCKTRPVRWGYSSASDDFYLSTSKIADYTDFPLIQYYIEKYGAYPSTLNYEYILDRQLLNLRISSLKSSFKNFNYDISGQKLKELRAVTNGIHSTFSYKEIAPDFYVVDIDERNIVLYIKESYDIVSKGCKYRITAAFTPDISAEVILGIVRDEIINLPEVEQQKADVSYINVLIQTQRGYELSPQKIACPDIDFGVNYNSDFEPIHNLIFDTLSVDNSKGLVLLHGDAGTGKTTYIRYLINKVKKTIIYIPPNMVNALSDPALIKFFIDHRNSVLVIEDAENVLITRNAGSTQAIANLLNISDGLLSDITNIQVVATFNTDIRNIDEALLRKGRLIAKYEFKPLELDRAEKLCENIGKSLNGSHTLADIYNADDIDFKKKTSKLGFKKT